MSDTVIKGGVVVDGTGRPGFQSDVKVTDGHIAEIGQGLHATTEIDASGLVVAPGFLDLHTHYDAQVFWDPLFTSSCWHGVTTVVAGNCGFTLAPARDEHHDSIIATLQAVEDMSLATLRAGIPWGFNSFGEYLDLIERSGVLLNFGCYVGHSTVRLFVMGDESFERAATEDELARMRQVVVESIESGAVGFSSSFAGAHFVNGRPVPSRQADRHEMVTLASALTDLDRGVVVYAQGRPLSYRDAYEMQREVGRPWMWTPLYTNLPEADYRDALAVHAEGRAAGADVWVQATCRPLAVQITLANPYMFRPSPSFRELEGRPEEERLSCFNDSSWRSTAFSEIDTLVRPHVNWDHVSVSESVVHAHLIGRSVGELGRERGQSPLDVYCELSVAENLETRFDVHLANYDEESVATILKQPGVVLGASDAGAHVAQLCDANMPTDLLGNWVRERGVLSLERAVQMLSSDIARLFGFSDRGQLEPGRAADIVVFDPKTVAPGPLRRVRDMPGDEERLISDEPEGMAHVLVNGQPIVRDGRLVDSALRALPGQVLRSTPSASQASSPS